jgi:hypothetical protein
MKYTVGMGSGVMMYTASFIKIGSGVQKLMGGAHSHRQHDDHISSLLFFQNKESRVANKY